MVGVTVTELPSNPIGRSASMASLAEVLEEADFRMRTGVRVGAAVWPTGFDPLDSHFGGGLRGGELLLLGGQQGLGKTTMALQIVRQAVVNSRSAVIFSYELEARSLIERFLVMEAAYAAGRGMVTIKDVRAAMEDRSRTTASIDERFAHLPGGPQALAAMRYYGDRLHIHESSNQQTDLKTIVQTVADLKERGQDPLVLVDYLQKIPVIGSKHVEEERVTYNVEGLKDLALKADVPIMAIVAAEKSALVSGRRMRLHDLRGSSALAYEADIALILNRKYDVVARQHLMYDMGNVDRFKNWAVLSIEKNRSGLSDIVLEFEKRFQEGRFENYGRMVQEQLIEERVFTE